MYEALIAELEVQDAQPIENDGKHYFLRELPFVTIRLAEAEILALRYQDEQSAIDGATRLKHCQKALNGLTVSFTEKPNSRQLCVHLNDSRTYLIHMLVNHVQREITFMTYTTFCSATEQFRNDMAFLKDLKEYLRRKSQLYHYGIKSVDTFGVIYHLEKAQRNEQGSQKEETISPPQSANEPSTGVEKSSA